jgi:hypothetical protein
MTLTVEPKSELAWVLANDLRQLIAEKEAHQRNLKAVVRSPHGGNPDIPSLTRQAMRNSAELTACYNLLHELRGSSYRHNIDPDTRHQYLNFYGYLYRGVDIGTISTHRVIVPPVGQPLVVVQTVFRRQTSWGKSIVDRFLRVLFFR